MPSGKIFALCIAILIIFTILNYATFQDIYHQNIHISNRNTENETVQEEDMGNRDGVGFPSSQTPPLKDPTSKERNPNKACRDVFEIGKTSKGMSEFESLVVEVIAKKKRTGNYLLNVFYEVASYQAPHMIKKVENGTGLGGSNLTLSKVGRLDQVDGQLAHLSCRLRQYNAAEVQQCLEHRSHRTTNNSTPNDRTANRTSTHLTRITYVGDSRIRQHTEVMLDLLRPLNPIITTHMGQVISVDDFLGQKGMKQWQKYKHNFTVEYQGGLLVEFRWAPLLHLLDDDPRVSTSVQPEFRMGGLDFLQALTEVEDSNLPDLVVLDTGAWQLHYLKESVVKQVDESTVYVMEQLRPLLTRLATRTTVVWALPDPLKDYISHDYSRMSYLSQQNNVVLEWLLNAQVALQPPGVIVWDSFLPVAYASLADCVDLYIANVNYSFLSTNSSFPPIMEWHCSEKMHIGMEVIQVAVQMTLNHLCNPYMDGDFCCSPDDDSPT